MASCKGPPTLPKPRRGNAGQATAALAKLAGRPLHDVRVKRRLRSTRQGMAAGWLLFAKRDWHLTAENLQGVAQASRVSMSLATIHNSLRQFARAGLCLCSTFSSTAKFETALAKALLHLHLEIAIRRRNRRPTLPSASKGRSVRFGEIPEGIAQSPRISRR
jgi:hypothetical protein